MLCIGVCDDWIFKKFKYPALFAPTRRFDSSLISNISIEVNFTEKTKRKITERDLAKFIGHLHPMTPSLGGARESPTFVIDLALQKLGFLDANFIYCEDSKFDRLRSHEAQTQLIESIIELAHQHDIALDENQLRLDFSDRCDDMIQRFNALVFFRQCNFEQFDFQSAFYFINQSLSHDQYYLPVEHPFIAKINAAKQLVNSSYKFNLEINEILALNENDDIKLKQLKDKCEQIISEITNKGSKLLLQIQATGRAASHAVYAVVKQVSSTESSPKIGLQLCLVNGGDGLEHHKVKTIKIDEKTERIPHVWSLAKEWEMFIERKSSTEHVHHKIVQIKNVDDKEEKKVFCYYLMLCCAGKYLYDVGAYQNHNDYLEFIYSPKGKKLKHDKWINSSRLNFDHLKIFDAEETLPKQIMGNCAIHNAIYAVQYAVKLSPLERKYMVYFLEIGMDIYRSTFEANKINSLLSNVHIAHRQATSPHILLASKDRKKEADGLSECLKH